MIFEKDGEEVNGEENIIKKIDDINNQIYSKKEISNNYYMLEFPIKNIENISLLKNLIFVILLDFHNNDDSFNSIFSLFDINNIFFEIFIIDSSIFESNYLSIIFKKLSDKNCLIKKNNIFNINKIDIDEFQYFFILILEMKNIAIIFLLIYMKILCLKLVHYYILMKLKLMKILVQRL